VFEGYGLAPDGWGLMQYCDDLSVCVSDEQVDLVKAIVPGASCSPDPGLCSNDQRCVLEYGLAVGQFYIDMACELSMVPGLNAVTCSAY
jgi:hypothetical protein